MAGRLIWKGQEVEARVAAASQAAVDETNEAGATLARGAAPFRTGELQGSIGTEPASVSGDQVKGQLVARAPHSIFVELGTSKMPAQPYLRPSADAENSKLAGRIRSRLKCPPRSGRRPDRVPQSGCGGRGTHRRPRVR